LKLLSSISDIQKEGIPCIDRRASLDHHRAQISQPLKVPRHVPARVANSDRHQRR
jgi:hypothetical protein